MEASSRIHTIHFKPRSNNLKQQINMDIGPVARESEDDDQRMAGGDGANEDDKRKRSEAVGGGKKVSIGGGGGSSIKMCQADKCAVGLGDAKAYHRRHRVCEHHAKAQAVVVAGVRQRFCQQCSRFHELVEFDESKRSCRRRLAGHNERRRKNQPEHPTGNSQTTNNKGSAPAAAPSLLSPSSPLLF